MTKKCLCYIHIYILVFIEDIERSLVIMKKNMSESESIGKPYYYYYYYYEKKVIFGTENVNFCILGIKPFVLGTEPPYIIIK